MKLSVLLKDLPLESKNLPELEITGISSHCDHVQPGFLFLAKKGSQTHGNRFVEQAIQAGAVAVITDNIQGAFSVLQIIYHNVCELELTLVQRFYGPLTSLNIIGITGTSGKTTTSYLIHHLLEKYQKTCGLIGSIYCQTPGQKIHSILTTPDLCTNFRLLRQMKEEGCDVAIMEVTSIAIDQGRVQGIPFDTMIFTNLSHDHLDYHLTMENYQQAKAKIFQCLDKKHYAIINGDDLASNKMIQNCRAHVFRYGFNPDFDLFVSDCVLSAHSMKFQVHWKHEEALFETNLIGEFNVYNILAATLAALIQGMKLQDIALALRDFSGVCGRLERVIHPKGYQVFIDYAHKPEALQNVLQTLSQLKEGKLILVFGCGGNRDPLKRPKMGRIAETFADIAIATNDNPRDEDPQEIINQILQGTISPEKIIVELDRKKAILYALEMAQPSDIILIAGKGHEMYQIFSDHRIDFDDRKIVLQSYEG